MYTFVRAIAVEFGPNQRWKEVDISTAPTSTLFTKYRQIYAVLSHSLVLEEMTLDLEDVAAEIQLNRGTISDYLLANGNKTLPTTLGTPTVKRNNAVYSDALQADFNVASIDYTVGEGVQLPEEEKPHLVITPQNDPEPYDFLKFRKRVLANVNGFYHRTAADSKGYYVVDGNKSRMKANQNYVGLVSFGTMGDLEFHDITEDMLAFETSEVAGQSPQVDKIHLKFSRDCDICNKTPILFVGGYMVLLDADTLLMTNSNILTLKTRKYPFVERYFESSPYLDFTGFDPQHQTDNPAWVMRHSFLTEAYLRKYMTMSQSFLMLVPTSNLVVEKEYPELQTVPHTYMQWETRPKWPLVVGEGKHEVYWSQYEANSWVLRGHDTYKRAYMHYNTGTEQSPAVDNTLWMGMAGRYGAGYFLKLFSEDVTVTV